MTQYRPLAEKHRPALLDDFIGQKHLLKPPSGLLYRMMHAKRPASVVFWGPPGCGKTTLANIYMKAFSFPIATIQATSSQVAEFKQIIDRAEQKPLIYLPTMVWIDEIHRLTKTQQDVLLASLEKGIIILVAATTENPSFQLRPALLSRVQVLTLEALQEEDLHEIVQRIEEKEEKILLTEKAKRLLIQWAGGDARCLINWVERLLVYTDTTLDEETLSALLDKPHFGIDATGEGRYQLISALHKAVRGSDCQAALYWLSRQLVAGEDGRYIARRLVRMATEDIGLADPDALGIALNGMKTFEALGSPEGELALAEVVVYLALAPKSNAIYTAFKQAMDEARKTHGSCVPKHLVNAATKWMQKEGFGKGYIYEHDQPGAISEQTFFPDNVEEKNYYAPVLRGFERELQKRIDYFARLKKNLIEK